MNEKRYIEVSRLAWEAMWKSTGGYENWTSYLRTAAQFYKYPFAHQLLIHAQNTHPVSETASSKASVIERLEEKKRKAAANTLSNAKRRRYMKGDRKVETDPFPLK